MANETLTGVAARSEVSVAAATFVGPDAHFVFLAGEVPLAESCCGEGERATLVVARGDAWRVSVSARVRTCQAFIPERCPSAAAHQCRRSEREFGGERGDKRL